MQNNTIKPTIVFDVRKKHKSLEKFRFLLESGGKIITLSPYASYICDVLKLRHTPIGKSVDIRVYRDSIIEKYKEIESMEWFNARENGYWLRDVAQYITFELYLKICSEVFNPDEAIYVRDFEQSSLLYGELNKFFAFKRVEKFLDIDSVFYTKSKLLFKIGSINERVVFSKLKSIVLGKESLRYDLSVNADEYNSIPIDIRPVKSDSICLEFSKFVESEILRDEFNRNNYIDDNYYVFEKTYKPFTFLSGKFEYHRLKGYVESGVPSIFYQHGSYVNENYFLKYCEVLPSDINFVFNEFTRDLFKRLGSKNVVGIGSSIFSRDLREKKIKYDYVYITYCTQYSNSGFYIGSDINELSPDASNIFSRHMEICKYFGEVKVDKKICIKLQPHIALGSQCYIPILDMARKYPNVDVSFFGDLFSIIEVSDIVLADYFSSEFNNHELLAKKEIVIFDDIIRIQSSYLSEIREFCNVVSSNQELFSYVENPPEIEKNHEKIKRYSSYGVDTKSVVSDFISRNFQK